MIRLLVLDVDGTMTDGGVYYDSAGNELKKFAIKDGAGIVLALFSSVSTTFSQVICPIHCRIIAISGEYHLRKCA